MFRNKENDSPVLQEEKNPRNHDNRHPGVPTMLASGAEFRGDLKSPGAVMIEGTVEGTVSAIGDVQIGPKGNASGEIEARNITVAGTVKGKIFAEDKVTLVAGAHVEGDIHSQSLKIVDSVYFQGGCVMGEGARKRRADTNIKLPSSIRMDQAA